jgi:hypothetical protein
MFIMTIASRFCGPPNTGNGGYVCGMLARHIDGAVDAAVRAPVPLATALVVIEAQPGTMGAADR